MSVNVIFSGCDSFQDREQRDLRFVRLVENKNKEHSLLCWDIQRSETAVCKGINPQQVSIEVLKDIKVWDKLTTKEQQNVHDALQQEKEIVHVRMENARKSRKGKEEYAHLPRQIACSNCSKVEKISPSILRTKASLLLIDNGDDLKQLSTWLETYQCAKCSPRKRGRQANPLYKDVPRTAKCSKCGKECTTNIKKLYADCKGNEKQMKKFCNKYLCRSCNPDWGSWLKGKGKRGRKCKPENEGFPKKAKCISCGKEVGIIPDHIRGKAKKLKITVDELIKSYHCRSCGGVVPHKKKRKKSKR